MSNYELMRSSSVPNWVVEEGRRERERRERAGEENQLKMLSKACSTFHEKVDKAVLASAYIEGREREERFLSMLSQ